jgi:hypothetical protein
MLTFEKSDYKPVGSSKSGSSISKVPINLSIDQNPLVIKSVANAKRGSHQIIKVKPKQNLDCYISLRIDADFDIYTFKKNPALHRTFPLTSSTKYGKEDEFMFSSFKKGQTYFISVVKNSPKRLKPNQSKFELTFEPFPKNQSPEMLLPNDPYFSNQWHLYNLTYDKSNSNQDVNTFLNFDIGAPEAWWCNQYLTDRGQNGNPSVIAVIDSGVDITHPDLKDNIWISNGDDSSNKQGLNGWDVVNNKPNTPERAGNHGTHVAGIIAATANNNEGIAGISWNSKIMGLNVLSEQGTTSDDDIIKAINFAVKNGANVINMSLGSPIKLAQSDLSKAKLKTLDKDLIKTIKGYRKAFTNARKNDVLIVMAAGNFGQVDYDVSKWANIGDLSRNIIAPYDYALKTDNIILVGSVASNMRLPSYSSHASRVDIAAPGGSRQINYEFDPITGSIIPIEDNKFNKEETRSFQIYSTITDGRYAPKLGTSMAAPMVSAAAGMLREFRNDLSAKEVKEMILDHSRSFETLIPYVEEGRTLHLADMIFEATDCEYQIDGGPVTPVIE